MDRSPDGSKGPDSSQVRIILRPYASAMPLASFAFGIGNVLYSAYLLHWIPKSESAVLAVMLLAFVAPLELFPSVMAFLSRDSGGATAFGIFGASWVVEGIQLLIDPSGQPSPATGIFLLLLAFCLIVIAVLSFKGKPLLGGLLTVAVLRSIGAALTEFGLRRALETTTAILGLVLGALAFYCAVAFLEEDLTQRISPLTFRSGQAKEAMEGSLDDQIETLTREAGVRKQL